MTNKEAESRRKILDCARELYVEFGLRKTSMDDVAKRAGIGRATLYRRYSDKDQLFQAVIFREVKQDLSRIEKRIRGIENHLDGLMEAFTMAVLSIHNNSLLRRLLVTEPEQILPFLTSNFEKIMVFSTQFLGAQITVAQNQGHIKMMDANITAEMILRLVQSSMLSPGGLIDAANEESIRQFADGWIRPLLTP